jgi:RNA polymerase sigma factor (sigma-70 family)
MPVPISIRLEQPASNLAMPVYAEVLDGDLCPVTLLQLYTNRTEQIELTPGKYLLRARLPSGETLREPIAVPSEGRIAPFILRGPLPPNAELSLQYLLGDLKEMPHPLPDRDLESTWLRLWHCVDRKWESTRWPAPFRGLEEVAVSELSLPLDCVHFLQIGGPLVPHRFIALPPSRETLRVLICATRHNTGFTGGVAVRITTTDAEAEVLMRYDAMGATGPAASLAELLTAQLERSAGTESDPNRALLACYFLLKSRDYARLDTCLSELDKQSRWLLDASIIRAISDAARGHSAAWQLDDLVPSSSRVPIYTAGFSYLQDLLGQFRLNPRQHTAELNLNLRWVARYASAVDWTEPRTTFLGTHPEQPDPRGIRGIPNTDDLFFLGTISNVRSIPAWPPPGPDVSPGLISRLHQKEPSAVDEIYRQYDRALRGYLRARCTSLSDAEDLLQTTWIMILDNLHRFDPAKASFAAFAKYWASITCKRYYDQRNVWLHATVLFSQLTTESDREVFGERAELLDRTARLSGPEQMELRELLANTIQMVFEESNPPHQALAFGFCRLLGWTPRRFVDELYSGTLSELAASLFANLPEELFHETESLRKIQNRFMSRLHKTLLDEVLDPATRNRYPALHLRELAWTRISEYCTEPGTAVRNVSHWIYSVLRRITGKKVAKQLARPRP